MRANRIGTYEPLILLAAGGMASVHLARQQSGAGIERLIVMKRVHPHLLINREFCDMFVDEGRISSQIRHANVVSVIDVAEIDGELCLVQEYVESVSFADLLKEAARAGETLPPAVTARVVCDMLEGLHAAHIAVDLRGTPLEVVHRDVSPANIIVGTDGISRLIDFGIAKAATRLAVTESGVVKGKFAYMAPEQLKHQPVDGRTDVFAAAAVLYQGLTGVPAFGSSNDGDTVLRVLLGEISPPSSVVRTVPKALDGVVERGLERHPDERFSTASAFREAIEAACACASAREVAAVVERLAGATLAERRRSIRKAIEASSSNDAPAPAGSAPRPITSLPMARAQTPAPAPAEDGAVTVREELRPAKKPRPRLRTIGGAVLLLVAGVGSLAVWRHDAGPNPSASATFSASSTPPLAPASAAPPMIGVDAPPSPAAETPRPSPAAGSSAGMGSSAPSIPSASNRPASSPRAPTPRELHRKNPYAH